MYEYHIFQVSKVTNYEFNNLPLNDQDTHQEIFHYSQKNLYYSLIKLKYSNHKIH